MVLAYPSNPLIPLSELLVFVHSPDFLDVTLTTNKETYSIREQGTIELSVRDKLPNHIQSICIQQFYSASTDRWYRIYSEY